MLPLLLIPKCVIVMLGGGRELFLVISSFYKIYFNISSF